MGIKESYTCDIFSPDDASEAEMVAEFEGGKKYLDNGVRVISLYGDWKDMGRQWGFLCLESLESILTFIDGKVGMNIDKEKKYIDIAEKVFSHYPDFLKTFFHGASETSGLTIEELKKANAVEWAEPAFFCSGIACWKGYTRESLLYGRNYDAASYGALGKEVTVTVYHPSGAQAFATVGYGSEIYCVNGFNESGLFVELNNGMASSGFDVNYDISLSTTELFRLISEAHSMEEVESFFRNTESAAGFLIGVTDGESARCYEWFGRRVLRGDLLSPEGLMVMTNHFTNPEWEFPEPSEALCWQSHTRNAHLRLFAEENKGSIDIEKMCLFLRQTTEDGGPALKGYDMYQIVAVPSERMFYINIPGTAVEWAAIRLGMYF